MTTDFVYIIHFFYLVTNVPNGNVMADEEFRYRYWSYHCYFRGTITVLFINIKRVCWRWKRYCNLLILLWFIYFYCEFNNASLK